jgi:hypothetical protein
MVQPDCAGVIPPGPVSWYGVARPCAESGSAGTMMSQLTLAAVVVAVWVALAVADVLGHGVVDAPVVGAVVAVAVLVGVAVADAPVVGAVVAVAVLVALAVADAVELGLAVAVAVVPVPWPCPWPWPAAAAGTTYAAGDAQLALAALLTFRPEWSTTTTMAPTTTASATGTAIGTARRASGPLD